MTQKIFYHSAYAPMSAPISAPMSAPTWNGFSYEVHPLPFPYEFLPVMEHYLIRGKQIVMFFIHSIMESLNKVLRDIADAVNTWNSPDQDQDYQNKNVIESSQSCRGAPRHLVSHRKQA